MPRNAATWCTGHWRRYGSSSATTRRCCRSTRRDCSRGASRRDGRPRRGATFGDELMRYLLDLEARWLEERVLAMLQADRERAPFVVRGRGAALHRTHRRTDARRATGPGGPTGRRFARGHRLQDRRRRRGEGVARRTPRACRNCRPTCRRSARSRWVPSPSQGCAAATPAMPASHAPATRSRVSRCRAPGAGRVTTARGRNCSVPGGGGSRRSRPNSRPAMPGSHRIPSHACQYCHLGALCLHCRHGRRWVPARRARMSDLRAADAEARERASTSARVSSSQAPAGAGKTELLTRRFLRAAGDRRGTRVHPGDHVHSQGAAEMRDRILARCAPCMRRPGPSAPRTHGALARAALAETTGARLEPARAARYLPIQTSMP